MASQTSAMVRSVRLRPPERICVTNPLLRPSFSARADFEISSACIASDNFFVTAKMRSSSRSNRLLRADLFSYVSYVVVRSVINSSIVNLLHQIEPRHVPQFQYQ